MTDRFDLTPLKEEAKKKAVREALAQIQSTAVGKDVLGSLSSEQKIRICEVLPEERHNSTTPDHTIHLIFDEKKDGFEVSTHLLLHEMVHERQHQNGLQTRQIGRFEDVILNEVLGELEAKTYETIYTDGTKKMPQTQVCELLNNNDTENKTKRGKDLLPGLLRIYGGSKEGETDELFQYATSQINEHLEARFYLGFKKEQTTEKIYKYYGETLGLSEEVIQALKGWFLESIVNQKVNDGSYPITGFGRLIGSGLEKGTETSLIPIVFKGAREERLIFVSEDDEGRLTLYDKDKKKLASDEKGHHFKDEKGNLVCSLVTDEKGDNKSAIIYGSDGKKMIEWGKTPFGVESKHIIGERVRFAGKNDEYDVELQINAKGMHYWRDGEIKTISRDAVYGSEVLVNALKEIQGRS